MTNPRHPDSALTRARRTPMTRMFAALALVAGLAFADGACAAVARVPAFARVVEREVPAIMRAARIEGVAVPIGLETLDDFRHIVPPCRDDRVVARFGEVFRRPVERFHECRVVVDDHRLFVREIEGRVRVLDVNICPLERFTGGVVVVLAVAASRVEHDSDVDATPPGRDHRLQQGRIGKDEHLHAKRPRGVVNRLEDRLGGIVGQHN